MSAERMVDPMPQKHEHEDFYNQRIKQNAGHIWLQIRYLLLSLVGVTAAGLVAYWLSSWLMWAAVVIAALVVSMFVLILLFSPTIWQPFSMIVRLYRQKRIALQHPAIVTQSIWNAYNSVQNELASWREKKTFSTPVFRKMLRIYYELDKLSTREIERLREEAGFTSAYGQSFPYGKTLKESLINTLYAARLQEEEAKAQATEEALKRSQEYTKTEPSLQRRKERELEKEALGQELSNYVGKLAQIPIELEEFGGGCVIYQLAGRPHKVVFTLSAGSYTAELYDRREQKGETVRFTLEREFDSYDLQLNGRPLNIEETQIFLRKQGSAEERDIPLW